LLVPFSSLRNSDSFKAKKDKSPCIRIDILV
jgi:hypothetical protein